MQNLLDEALEIVDADEEARAQSWTGEIERGELVLDLGDRIRDALKPIPTIGVSKESHLQVNC